jgi:NADH-quinone oxidoreductase subunit M
LLWLYQRVFFGTVTNPKNEKLQDLTPREILTFAPLIVMALWIGLYPKPFFQILEQPVNQIVQTIQDSKANPNLPVNAMIATPPEMTSQTTEAIAPRVSRAAPGAGSKAIAPKVGR